jgi:hypothetical protein
MVVALAGVTIGLGGVAFATIPDSSKTIHGCYNKSNGNLRVVESAGDCRKNETALPWNQQGPPGTPGGAAVTFQEQASEVSTASGDFVDLGGPNVTVNVSSSGLIGIFSRAEMRGDGCQVISLFEITDFNPPVTLLASCANPSYVKKWSTPTERFGTFEKEGATWKWLEVTPGTHTYSLRYQATAIDGTTPPAESDRAYFRNRKLWLQPTG